MCSNAARVFVEETIMDKFLEEIVKRTSNICVGDPAQVDTQMGALISEEHLQKVLNYVELGKKEVGRLMLNFNRGLGSVPVYIIKNFHVVNNTENLKSTWSEVFTDMI